MKLKSRELKSQELPQTHLIGQFVSYAIKDGYKVKRLNLLTADGLQSVKLSKAARACIFRLSATTPIRPGTLLSLAVESKFDHEQWQYKVYDLQILAAGTAIEIEPLPVVTPAAKTTKIRVCDRGTCRKRGSQAIYQQLQQEIIDRGLGDQVILEKTGCLKACKHGPNVAIGKTCHSRICPRTIAPLLSPLG